MKRGIAKLVKLSFKEAILDVPPQGSPIKLTIEYSFDDPHLTGELWDAVMPKFPGRPALPNTFEILDAAAKAKATKGKYRQVARRFGKSPKHVTDLVNTHRPYFLKKLAEFTTTNKS